MSWFSNDPHVMKHFSSKNGGDRTSSVILELKKRKNTAENSLMQLNGLFRSEQTDRQLHVQVIYVEVHALSQALPRQHKDTTPTPSYSVTQRYSMLNQRST